jgi:hypothetical protein
LRGSRVYYSGVVPAGLRGTGISVYPRFYGPEMAAAKLPYEFQCGTGTVAVCIASAQRGLLPPDEASGHIVFEWGSQRAIPDPYGIRTTDVDFATHAGRLVRVSFSHSVIEILAKGRLTLPALHQPGCCERLMAETIQDPWERGGA